MSTPRLVLFASALLAGLLVLGVQRQPTVAAQDKGAPKPLTAPFTKAEAEQARADWAKYLKVPERKTLDLGGSWNYISRGCRAAFRVVIAPDGRSSSDGFRVVVALP
jgi:hypothetical protein